MDTHKHAACSTESRNLSNTLKRLSRALLLSLAILSLVIQSTPLYAHEGEEHAADDLVGVPIAEIEKKTQENKTKKLRETGVEPGAARTRDMETFDQTASIQAVAADPGVSGSWSSVINTPVVPVFQAVLPNGKVLIWDSVGDNASENYQTHNFTRAMVWNPATNTSKRVDVAGYNIFCAGFAHMENGNILIAGGNKDSALAGIVQTHVFNWQTETWTRGRDMAAGRWYPSVATMANGEMAIIGGGPAATEVYQTNGLIRAVPGFTNTTYGRRLYPYMISRPDTLLQLMGPYTTTFSLNISGTGTITGTGTRDTIDRQASGFATYDTGKHLITGGGSVTEDGATKVPTKTSVIVNSSTSLVPTTTATASMAQGRRQHNTTMIADGSVLVTGGMTSAASSGLIDLNNAATSAEQWNPATGTWTVLSSSNRIRQYHSTAALLPDGRVMTGGGGICGVCQDQGYLEKNIEYFSPPYLFKKDGSGALATRPTISTAPASVPINAGFAVTSTQAASIRKVALVGLGDVTHSVDQGQRYVPLKFTTSGTTLNVTGPSTGGVTPPGYYMLFIVDAAGVPSVAKIVKVARGVRPLMNEVRNTAAVKCIDVPAASVTIKTYLQIYTCNGTKAQSLTRLTSDNSLRVLGNCLDVPSGKYIANQKIWTYSCNNTTAQKWDFRTDGTIRPMGKTTLCLSAASTVNKAALILATCNGTTIQKWAW